MDNDNEVSFESEQPRYMVKENMKDLTGHYRKSDYDAMALLPYIDVVMERAEKLDISPTDKWSQNIGTKVYLLAKSIMGK